MSSTLMPVSFSHAMMRNLRSATPSLDISTTGPCLLILRPHHSGRPAAMAKAMLKVMNVLPHPGGPYINSKEFSITTPSIRYFGSGSALMSLMLSVSYTSISDCVSVRAPPPPSAVALPATSSSFFSGAGTAAASFTRSVHCSMAAFHFWENNDAPRPSRSNRMWLGVPGSNSLLLTL